VKGLRGILSVARYERMMLMRTTRYRVLGGIGIGIPIFIGVILGIAEARGGEAGTAFGLGAIVPFYVYSFLQTFVIAFIAGDFRAADERAHVHEVIAVQPLSTTELVVGKYLGILQALMALSLAVMTVTVSVQAAKLSVMGTPFRVAPYLGFLVLMNLPALAYMTALTFSLGALLRQRTAAALVALAYVIGTVFFLGDRYGGIFDFGAFYAPLFYSDLLGFGDLSRVIELRIFYVVAAVFLLGVSVERFPRLAQSGRWRWAGRAVALAALAVCVTLFVGMLRDDAAAIEQRAQLLRAHATHAALPAGQIVHYDLEVRLVEAGWPLAAEAGMRVRNPGPDPLNAVILSLNPGLEITATRDDAGRALTAERDGAVVVVSFPAPLAAGAETTIHMEYRGGIDLNGFDLIRTAPRRERTDGPLQLPQLTAWIRPHSVYLPARSRWYPASGVDYGHTLTPQQSFATAEIRVVAPAGLVAITQGDPVDVTVAADGLTAISGFKVERAVPALTLNVGVYETYETRVGDVDMALYVHPDHASFIGFFEDASEEVLGALDQLLGAIVRETGLPYPYARLNVVEVPLVVQWYYEGWREVGGLTGPGVLMIEEDVLTGQNFERSLNGRRRGSDGELDEVAAKRDILVSLLFRLFLSPEGERYGIFRSPLVQLWSYDRAFVGEQSALLERGMPVFMQQDVGSEVRSMMLQRGGGRGRFQMRGRGGGDAAMMEAAAASRGQLLGSDGSDWNAVLDAMQQQTFAEMNPDADPELYRSVLDNKGVSIFRMMKAVAGAGAFVRAVESFADESRYADVDFGQFEAAIMPVAGAESNAVPVARMTAPDPFGADLERLVKEWLDGTSVPGYSITGATVRKLENARSEVVHQVAVRVRNGEPGLGFVKVSAVGFRDEVSKGVQIEGGSEVEVALVIADRPTRVTVETFFAKNRRSLVAPLRVPDKVQAGRPESYVHVVTEEESPFIEIIVDNEDEGFSMPVRRVQRYLRPGLEGGQWWVRSTMFAYGRYENNYRMKSAGDGAQPAVWSALMPRTGEYDIAYYYLPESYPANGVWGLASYSDFTILHGDETRTVRLEEDHLKGGWNLLGRFHFEAGEEVSVELSDRADGRLYADAMRWRFADSDLVYEEDVAPWDAMRRPPGAGARRGRR